MAALAAVFSALAGCSGPRVTFAPDPLPAPLAFAPPRAELASPRLRLTGHRPAMLSVMAGGDVMIGHWTLRYLEEQGPGYPFAGIAPLLGSTDVVFANLEAPFADSGEAVEGKTFTFKVPVRYAGALRDAGFNLLSIANNHILDFGFSGLEQTLRALRGTGLAHAGAGMTLDDAWRPAVVHTRAGKVAMLAFAMTFPKEFWANDSTGGTAYPYEEVLAARLDSLDALYEHVIVSFHWGTEKKSTPNTYQSYFARLAIDHGADLVLGHHPHVLQGLELYKNRLIAYSLGNLAFASFSKDAVNSMLLKVVMHEQGLLFAKVIPLNVDNAEVTFQPRLATPPRAQAIVAHLDSLSHALNGRDILTDDGLVFGEGRSLLDTRISAQTP